MFFKKKEKQPLELKVRKDELVYLLSVIMPRKPSFEFMHNDEGTYLVCKEGPFFYSDVQNEDRTRLQLRLKYPITHVFDLSPEKILVMEGFDDELKPLPKAIIDFENPIIEVYENHFTDGIKVIETLSIEYNELRKLDKYGNDHDYEYEVEKKETTFSYKYFLEKLKRREINNKNYKWFKYFMKKSPLWNDKWYYHE